MSDATVAAAERVTFDHINLFTTLSLPDAVQAGFLPEHAADLRAGITNGLRAPLLTLIDVDEHLSIPKHPLESQLINLENTALSQIQRLRIVRLFARDKTVFSDQRNAELYMNMTFIDLQDFAKTVGKVKKWRASRINDAVRTMSAELLPPPGQIWWDREPWVWWLNQAIDYEERKLEYIEGITGIPDDVDMGYAS